MHRKIREKAYTRIVSRDADELSEILTNHMGEVRVRPIDNKHEIHFQTTVSYHDFLFDTLFPSGGVVEVIEKNGEMGVDLYGLYLSARGSLELHTGFRRDVSRPGSACIIDLTTCSRRIHSEQHEHLAIGIGRAEMAEHLANLIERPVQGSLDFTPNIDLTKGPGLTIMALASTLKAGFSGEAPLLRSPIALERMKETMIALLLEGVPHRFSDELHQPIASASPYYVKRAIDFMWANASRPISSAEIAAECGVGVRALNSSFHRFKNMPMMAYLREIRLNAVRRDLQDPAITAPIAEIALKWGFTQLGRFSGQYQSRFAELPSQTLQQSRRRR